MPGRDGLYVSGGYSGVGNVPGFMCGRDIADTIAGTGPRAPLPRRPRAMDGPGGRGMIGDLHEQERERFAERTRASRELFERASSAPSRAA